MEKKEGKRNFLWSLGKPLIEILLVRGGKGTDRLSRLIRRGTRKGKKLKGGGWTNLNLGGARER